MNDSAAVIRFASDYTRYPGGRLRKHGPYSGEQFREDVLWPLLEKNHTVSVDLSGTYGFGSSFLDESFGEIGNRLGYSETKARLSFTCEDDPTLVDLIWAKIAKASRS